MVATCETIEVKCNNNNIPGQCTGTLIPCGCDIVCEQPNVNIPPVCNWSCNQTDPLCGNQPCLPPAEPPNCCYDNPSWCTTAKNCNPTSDPFPAWLIFLVIFLAFLLIFV